eukprot:5187590-Pleurochrysis_carterae.AAC.6
MWRSAQRGTVETVLREAASFGEHRPSAHDERGEAGDPSSSMPTDDTASGHSDLTAEKRLGKDLWLAPVSERQILCVVRPPVQPFPQQSPIPLAFRRRRMRHTARTPRAHGAHTAAASRGSAGAHVNLGIPSPLLSRFDVVLLLRDTQSAERDCRVADHILRGDAARSGRSAAAPL